MKLALLKPFVCRGYAVNCPSMGTGHARRSARKSLHIHLDVFQHVEIALLHISGLVDNTRERIELGRDVGSFSLGLSAALPVPPLRQSEPTSADSASPPGKARSCQYRPSRHFRRLMRAEGSFASRRCSGIMRYLT